MHSFVPVEEGYASWLTSWEREYLAGLLDQVARVLATEPPAEEAADDVAEQQSHGQPAAGAGGAPASGPAGPDDHPAHQHECAQPGDTAEGRPRAGETSRDAEVLASLDFDPDPEPTAGTPSSSASAAPLLEVLLPDASEDPQVAVEIASLTRARLRRDKRTRLETAVAELLAPTGTDGAVLVRNGQEQDWLGALNDVRLVLAERLGIDGPEAAQEVHAAAWEQDPPEEGAGRWRHAMALSYDMLTWWQESLLTSVLSAE